MKAVQFISNLILILASALVINLLFNLSNNTLFQNGNWEVTKANLEKGVKDGTVSLVSNNTVALNRLNLGEWQGGNEIIFKDPIAAKEIGMEFNLSENSYFHFIFNKVSSGFSGFRMSSHPDFPNRFYTANSSGAYLHSMEVNSILIEPHTWHKFNITFSDSTASVKIDGNSIGKFTLPLFSITQVGLRGSHNPVYIDNFYIQSLDNLEKVQESFEGQGWNLFFFSFVALLLLSSLLYFFIQDQKSALRWITQINILVLMFSGTYFLLDFYMLSGDQNPDDITHFGMETHIPEMSSIEASLSAQFSAEPNAHEYRILFMGNSQSWGAGASAADKGMVSIFQQKLNQAESDSLKYICMNAAMPGIQLHYAIEKLEKEWIHFKPRMLFLNWSNYVNDAEVFEAQLDSIYEICKAHNVELVLNLEAQNIEVIHSTNWEHKKWSISLEEIHNVILDFCMDNKLQMINLHQALNNKSDMGIMWWNMTELTDFGHEEAGQFLYDSFIDNSTKSN